MREPSALRGPDLAAGAYNDWDDKDDKPAANRVCASYDQAGILIDNRVLDEVPLRNTGAIERQ